MTALETMGAFIAEGVRGRIPAATRATVRRHLTDTVGAWIAGARTMEGRRLMAHAMAAAASTDDVARDIGLHCALARLSETDNIHLASTTTPGGIVIPAALTIAAARPDTTADALIEAVVVGTEAMVRLGHAIGGPTVLYRGIWPTCFAAPFGVAAATARLHDFDAAAASHALALALTLASPGVGHHNAETTSRWFAVGQAARNGFIAAQAAHGGFTSDLNLLDGSFLQGIYGITADVEAFLDGFGRGHAIDETSFKPWCAARQTIAATQALVELIERGLSIESITSVEVRVPPPYLKMIDHGVKPRDRASHLTSVQYHLALAACDPAKLHDVQHSPQRIADNMQAFMQKISVSADPALLTHYPKAWPACVVVRSAGASQEQLVVHVPGDPQRPFDDRDVDDKLRRMLGGVDALGIDQLRGSCRSAVDGNGAAAALVREVAKMVGAAGIEPATSPV